MKKISFNGLFILIVTVLLFLNGCYKIRSVFAKEVDDTYMIRSLQYLTERLAVFCGGKIQHELRALETLANIMGDCETVLLTERRDRFDDMLLSVMKNEPNIVQIYTVWKPNALDGVDSRYIGRTGSSPTGQYAMAYTRETGQIIALTSKNIDVTMTHINGPNARRVRADDPVSIVIYGKETFVFNMVVPIINPRTNEVVGGIGCLLRIDIFQSIVEQHIKSYEEIVAMEIYSSNGFIIGSFLPLRIGTKIPVTDTTLYGANIYSAYDAINTGKSFNCKSHISLLNTDVEIVMCPFIVGDHHWVVMIASPINLWR
jgi:methyl-accepting chemotaxis protein